MATGATTQVDRGPALEAGLNILPIEPVERDMVRFDAGVITFGVEYRHLTTEISRQNLRDNVTAGRAIPDVRC